MVLLMVWGPRSWSVGKSFTLQKGELVPHRPTSKKFRSMYKLMEFLTLSARLHEYGIIKENSHSGKNIHIYCDSGISYRDRLKNLVRHNTSTRCAPKITLGHSLTRHQKTQHFSRKTATEHLNQARTPLSTWNRQITRNNINSQAYDNRAALDAAGWERIPN
ncbi:hypothetical protein VP01_991g2 [Puccinia sorghi]|uniref:Uncharacterized protein n=1 Tax=Puccinia sorghi TaxID=27349 RepID=A0A0L6U7E7_9BASI|nr:hypothetical protein VP01_991g2 [Puccinia sorghi]